MGSHTVQAAATVSLSENFEIGSKGAYSAGSVQLSSGSWLFDNALLGNLTSDQKDGSGSARIRSAGSIAMNFDVAGAASVRFSHANFGSDTGTAWQLQMSTDSGTTWTDVSTAAPSGSSLQQASFTVNQSGNVRFRILVSGTSGNRINIDDFQILN